MYIPKTNRSFEVPLRENDQTKLLVVAFFQQSTSTLRKLTGGALLLASLIAPLHSHAAPLNASAMAGTETVSLMTTRYSGAMVPEDAARDTKLRFDSDFLEAEIADFAAQRAQRGVGKGNEARLTEFSSFRVGNETLSSAPVQTSDDTENTSFRDAGSAAAAMPFMVIVSLFGIGLIGIATVGRRKQSHPRSGSMPGLKAPLTHIR